MSLANMLSAPSTLLSVFYSPFSEHPPATKTIQGIWIVKVPSHIISNSNPGKWSSGPRTALKYNPKDKQQSLYLSPGVFISLIPHPR